MLVGLSIYKFEIAQESLWNIHFHSKSSVYFARAYTKYSILWTSCLPSP